MGIIKKTRYLLEYAGAAAFFHSVRMLPPRFLRFLAGVFGFFVFLVPSCRSIIMSNLEAAFPEMTPSERRKIGRKSAANVLLSLLEFFWFSGNPHKVRSLIRLSDEICRYVNGVRAEKRSLLFVVPHFGNWEIAAFMFNEYFPRIPFAVVARSLPNPYLDRLINSGRMVEGNLVIGAKGAVKGMLKALRDGYFMATLIDQNTRVRDGGIFVNFFGLPVPTSPAPALFARKIGTELAVATCLRADNGYDGVVVPLSKKVPEYGGDEEIIQELMEITEKLIRERPDQYLWFYKRFQHIPAGASEELARKFPPYAAPAPEKFYRKRKNEADKA